MSKPAHKNLEHPPGQIVNDVDPHYQFAKAQYENDLDLRPRRLGDIIDRVQRQEELFQKKKLTFEEWAEESQMLYRSVENKSDLEHFLKECWKAAQENT